MKTMDVLLSPRRRRALGALGALGTLGALGAAALAAGCSARPDPRREMLSFGGDTMGSSFSVRIAGGPFPANLEPVARAAVVAAFNAVVERMSSFDAATELRRFNGHDATSPFALSAETLAVLAQAQQVAAASGGAFDITVAPLVRAWGFGADAAMRGAAPSAGTLATLAPNVGWRQLAIDAAAGTVCKATPALQLDLSGIAKGYAVDRAALALEALGLTRYMVEAGGEIRARGLNAEGRPWQIAIEKPDAWPQQPHRIVPLQGLAMATSGDYRNYYELDGQRISHEIDPGARGPVAHALASVSVVHELCMAADAWATALFVLGPERGLALANQRGLAAHFIVRDAGGLREFTSATLAATLMRGAGTAGSAEPAPA